MFQHIVTVFQHIATETVSADIYIFFILCFQKTFCKFIIKTEVGSDAVSVAVTAVVSAAITAAVPASHVSASHVYS